MGTGQNRQLIERESGKLLISNAIKTEIMTESILIPKRWLKVAGLENIPRASLEKVVLACSGMISLRVSPDSNNLEILSKNQLDQNEGEALVYQAIADENLRQQIQMECDQEINSLINGILTKAARK